MATVPSIGRAAPEPGAPADATRDLYERFGRQIFAYCHMQLRNREEAEDAVQTTFLNAFRALERGVVPELESAWLYKIAQHVCLTRNRSFSRRRRIESPDDFETVKEFMGAPVRDTEQVGELSEALRALPEQQRRAILLREWQGLTYKEIAAEMDLSQAAVETLIFRARRGLAQTLEKLRASGDMGSVFAAIKSVLVGLGTKAAVTLVTVATTSVVAATPDARHGVIHFVNHTLQQAQQVVAPTKPDRPAQNATTSAAAATGLSAAASVSVPAVLGPLIAPHDAQPPLPATSRLVNNVKQGESSATTSSDASTARARAAKAAAVTVTPPTQPTTSDNAASPATATPSQTVTTTTPTTAKSPTGSDTTGSTSVGPTVNGFTPQSGTPGTIVQLIGKSFTGATAVRFNGASADFSVVSDTQINTKVPSSAASGQITIVTANGTVTTDGTFTVTSTSSGGSSGSGGSGTSGVSSAPAFTGFSPASASPGTVVYLAGKNFTGTTSVKFNGTSADFTVTSDGSYITTHVPSGATSGTITVVTAGGSATSSSSFTVTSAAAPLASPTFTGASPTSGGAGASVGIGGSHFTGATAVKFNGVSADFTVSSDTLIMTHVPTGATSGPITIVTPNGSVTSTSNFTVTTGSPPSISGTSPTSGAVSTTVTITGLYFTGATSVRFNGTSADFSINSDTSITTHVPTGATSGTIVVITPNGYTASGTFTVTSTNPSIDGPSPRTGPVGTNVTIVGHNFTGATSVKFNGTSASFTISSDTQINAVVPSGATTGPISVTTPNGTATSIANFTVTVPAAPAITTFGPTSGAVGASTSIGGSGFTGATSVKFNGVSASFTVANDGAISAIVPTGATTGPISVTTPNGTATSSGSFTVNH